MIQEFETASGSLYQVDTDNLRVRRLRGTHDPTPRQGTDGEWLRYNALEGPAVGHPVFIVWNDTDHRLRSTITTDVKSIRTVDIDVSGEPTQPPPIAQHMNLEEYADAVASTN